MEPFRFLAKCNRVFKATGLREQMLFTYTYANTHARACTRTMNS